MSFLEWGLSDFQWREEENIAAGSQAAEVRREGIVRGGVGVGPFALRSV